MLDGAVVAAQFTPRAKNARLPAGRLGTQREDARFALFLAGDDSGFFCGQGIPFAGGWAQ